MRVLTLREPKSGDASVLNEKIFVAKIKDNKVVFVDLVSQTPIWQTTQIVSNEATEDGVVVTTSSGSIYDMLDVLKLIPTSSKVELPPIDFSVVDQKITTRERNYCDGIHKTEFTFDRDITLEEFTRFLKLNSFKFHDAAGWWDDHHKIEGFGKQWSYIWVSAYTD